MAIVAQPADSLVAERVLASLETPWVREVLLGERDRPSDDGQLGQALADLASAQGRLHALDEDYYVHGALVETRYRSVKAKLERKIDHLQRFIDAATKQRVVLHPDPRAYWQDADIAQKRELSRLLVERVTILPARRGVPRSDSNRVRIQLAAMLRDHL